MILSFKEWLWDRYSIDPDGPVYSDILFDRHTASYAYKTLYTNYNKNYHNKNTPEKKYRVINKRKEENHTS